MSGLLLKVLALVLASASIVLFLGVTARLLYSAPSSGAISAGGYKGLEYLLVEFVDPRVLEVDWPPGFAGNTSLIEPFSNWSTKYYRGAEAYLGGGVYIFPIKSSKPFLVEVKTRPWRDPGYDLAQGLVSGFLALSAIVSWIAGGRLAFREQHSRSRESRQKV